MEAVKHDAVDAPTGGPGSGPAPADRAESALAALALDDLLALNEGELQALYRDASVPALDALNGDLRGRMLAVRVLSARVWSVLRRFAGSRFFPWRGKSFSPTGSDEGRGTNRLFSDRLRLLPFQTSIGPSRAGDFDAVQLDYDLPKNPFFIRAIKDEIRELRPGLYLGQAYLQLPKGTHLVLYFGLTSESDS
ncbi:MAG: hypothetical protein MJE77_30295 [Proteobacteria bacterium]|nr:hypothetical protein [Pseudomonadota bacterium]